MFLRTVLQPYQRYFCYFLRIHALNSRTGYSTRKTSCIHRCNRIRAHFLLQHTGQRVKLSIFYSPTTIQNLNTAYLNFVRNSPNHPVTYAQHSRRRVFTKEFKSQTARANKISRRIKHSSRPPDRATKINSGFHRLRSINHSPTSRN